MCFADSWYSFTVADIVCKNFRDLLKYEVDFIVRPISVGGFIIFVFSLSGKQDRGSFVHQTMVLGK